MITKNNVLNKYRMYLQDTFKILILVQLLTEKTPICDQGKIKTFDPSSQVIWWLCGPVLICWYGICPFVSLVEGVIAVQYKTILSDHDSWKKHFNLMQQFSQPPDCLKTSLRKHPLEEQPLIFLVNFHRLVEAVQCNVMS